MRAIVAIALAICSSIAVAAPRRDCPPPGATHHYFPVGSFESHLLQRNPWGDPELFERVSSNRQLMTEHETILRAGLGELLRAMDEPSLSCGAPGEQYRFLWSRSFLPDIVIRVFAADAGWRLVAVELDANADGTLATEPLRRSERTISAEQFAAARRAALAALAETDPREPLGNDGAHWFIEATNNDGWRMTDRWAPQDGAVRAAGLGFVRLTGWDIPADEIY